MGVHVIAPLAALAADPLPGGIALVPAAAAAGAVQLPAGCERIAVEIDGSETEEQLRALAKVDCVAFTLNIKVCELTCVWGGGGVSFLLVS